MKIIAWLAGIATLVTALAYLVVSLNRWEWNRALFFGLIVLIAEVGLATALILRKLGQLAARPPIDAEIAGILRDSRPAEADRFAWMREAPNQMSVFITFLVGGGVILSGVAWIVDRLASKTTTPTGEARLAAQLAPISYPSGGLLVPDATVLAQEVPGDDDTRLGRLLRGTGR
ncbi:MAG: hypothetical protein Q8K58_06020 [Acidimicrobiales bacterium]|nr:hypothetical protein [Acidimicrobiales bacterium]